MILISNYYLFEDEEIEANLVFDTAEIYTFIALWQEGKSLLDIAEQMNRTPLEIGLLVMDRAEVGDIQSRPQGIFA